MNFSLHPYNKVPLWKNPHCVPFSLSLPLIEANYAAEGEPHHENIKVSQSSQGDLQDRSTNVKANMSGWYMQKENDSYAWVCNKAINLALRNSPHKTDYEVADCWGATYTYNDYTKKHDHWPHVWSFVYYVECCEKCSPLLFHDGHEGTHYIYPKTGKMVLFPSILVHSVPKHTCSHDRIMVAGNIDLSK